MRGHYCLLNISTTKYTGRHQRTNARLTLFADAQCMHIRLLLPSSVIRVQQKASNCISISFSHPRRFRIPSKLLRIHSTVARALEQYSRHCTGIFAEYLKGTSVLAGESEMASATAAPAGQMLPKAESALFTEVTSSFDTRNYKRAVKLADQILKTCPNHGETLSMKALAVNCLGRKEEAFELVKAGLKANFKYVAVGRVQTVCTTY
jgi:hypothetical protein